jgi:hypothetical protein
MRLIVNFNTYFKINNWNCHAMSNRADEISRSSYTAPLPQISAFPPSIYSNVNSCTLIGYHALCVIALVCNSHYASYVQQL